MNGATVSTIWRYPVKSMLGEQIAAGEITERGLAGDRAYALVDVETGNIASAKNPRRWGMLFECRAAFLEEPDTSSEPPPARIDLPDGSTVRSDEADVDEVLSLAVGRAVHLATRAPPQPTLEEYWPEVEGVEVSKQDTVTREQIALLAPPGSFFDAAPVHLVTTSTLAALAHAHPSGRFDPLRFRPNMLISTDDDGFVENGWVDRTVRLGARVEIAVLLLAPRCVMTTLAQGELPADKGILQTASRENRVDIPGLGPSSCVGVYGVVSQGGPVFRGDGALLV